MQALALLPVMLMKNMISLSEVISSCSKGRHCAQALSLPKVMPNVGVTEDAPFLCVERVDIGSKRDCCSR